MLSDGFRQYFQLTVYGTEQQFTKFSENSRWKKLTDRRSAAFAAYRHGQPRAMSRRMEVLPKAVTQHAI